MKLIRNALVYKASLPSATALTKHLEEHPFAEPLPNALGSIGFVARRENLVDTFPGGLAFSVRIDDKIIPAASVKAEVEKRTKVILEQTGRRRLSKNEKAELKEAVTLEFATRALVRTKVVTAFYDIDNQYLIVPVTSRKVADRIISLLIQAAGSVKTETIHVSDAKHGLTTRIQAWLEGDEYAFGDFNPSGEAALAMDGQKVAVKMLSLTNAKEGLQEALRDGFTISSIGLQSTDEMRFRLTEDFAFKAIDFPTVPNEEEIEDAWLHEASVQLLHVSDIVNQVVELLSYKEEQKEAA